MLTQKTKEGVCPNFTKIIQNSGKQKGTQDSNLENNLLSIDTLKGSPSKLSSLNNRRYSMDSLPSLQIRQIGESIHFRTHNALETGIASELHFQMKIYTFGIDLKPHTTF